MCDDNCYYGGNSYFDMMVFGTVLFFLIMSIPALPMAGAGWYIGAEIIGNNFAKWSLSISFFIGGYYLFKKLLAKRTLYGVLFVVAQYLTLDIILTVKTHSTELCIISIIKAIIAWGMSNT
jgi:hypothetical protein